jgi:hypothetical protein
MASLLHLAAGTHGINARQISGASIYDRERRTEERIRYLDLDEAAVLAISDPILPAADAPGWRINQLHRLIDDFYNQMKPIWITVNVRDPKELGEKLSMQTYDRLRERAHLFPCFWPSYRQTVEPGA